MTLLPILKGNIGFGQVVVTRMTNTTYHDCNHVRGITIILLPIALIFSQIFSRNLKDTTLQSSQNTAKGRTLTCV